MLLISVYIVAACSATSCGCRCQAGMPRACAIAIAALTADISLPNEAAA
jgi:hypothetical protein